MKNCLSKITTKRIFFLYTQSCSLLRLAQSVFSNNNIVGHLLIPIVARKKNEENEQSTIKYHILPTVLLTFFCVKYNKLNKAEWDSLKIQIAAERELVNSCKKHAHCKHNKTGWYRRKNIINSKKKENKIIVNFPLRLKHRICLWTNKKLHGKRTKQNWFDYFTFLSFHLAKYRTTFSCLEININIVRLFLLPL